MEHDLMIVNQAFHQPIAAIPFKIKRVAQEHFLIISVITLSIREHTASFHIALATSKNDTESLMPVGSNFAM